MSWAFRTMIVSDSVVDTCRSLAQLLAGEGQVLWTTPLSADGAEPATHWISSGLIDESFALLMPLQEWVWIETDPETQDGYWEESQLSPGQPELLAQMATDAGMPMTTADVEAIFAQCDVTMDAPQFDLERMGLQMVQPPEPVAE